MKRFRYLADPLFLCSCALYALNRWALKPRVHNAFLRGHFNDLLLIPCPLPILLLLHRWLRLRDHDRMPNGGEIALNVVVWSILFEIVGPHIMRGTTGDSLDILAYLVGALVAWVWWQRPSFSFVEARGGA